MARAKLLILFGKISDNNTHTIGPQDILKAPINSSKNGNTQFPTAL